MLVTIALTIEAPGDSRPSKVMAEAMDAVDEGTPYRVTKGKLVDLSAGGEPGAGDPRGGHSEHGEQGGQARGHRKGDLT